EVAVRAQGDGVVIGDAGGNDLPVGLDGDAVDDVGRQGADGCDHEAAVAEARVELAGGGVAGECEVAAAAAVADAGHDDVAVGLEGEGVGPVLGSAEVGDGHPVLTEGRIERAAGEIAGDGEVVG